MLYGRIRFARPCQVLERNSIQRKGLVEEGLDFVLKPLTPKDLLRKVREILDRKKF